MGSEILPATAEGVKAALHPQHPDTKQQYGLIRMRRRIIQDFIMQQTMLRVKEPLKSLEFYSKVLGMSLLTRIDMPTMKFTVYFMGYQDPASIPQEREAQIAWALSRPATIELTHNWGSENDDSVNYHNGNSDPRGFGHIGIAVPDVYAACERFDSLGVEYVKKPDGGTMKGLAFIKDPDGYWIEIFNPNKLIKSPA